LLYNTIYLNIFSFVTLLGEFIESESEESDFELEKLKSKNLIHKKKDKQTIQLTKNFEFSSDKTSNTNSVAYYNTKLNPVNSENIIKNTNDQNNDIDYVESVELILDLDNNFVEEINNKNNEDNKQKEVLIKNNNKNDENDVIFDLDNNIIIRNDELIKFSDDISINSDSNKICTNSTSKILISKIKK
jgi:hypothetical protein